MPRPTYGSTIKTRVKRLFEVLLDFVNGEFDDSFDIEFKWQAQDSANPKLIVKTTLVVLEWLTAKDKYDGKLTKPQIREALSLLKDFLKILEDNRAKTQGVDTWHFTLTLWSKDKEKNLKQFEQAWESSRPEKSKALEANFHKSGVSAEASQNDFDWQDCCSKMFPTALSTNPLLSGDGVMLNIEDIVPLELVERKQLPQHQEDFSPEHFQVQASTESEVPVAHNQFFEQVLAKRNSEKSQGRKIAIIGEPGAGKTTFLQEIAHWIYPERGLPIFVRLADLQEKSLEEYLLNDWLKNATGKRRIPDEIQDDFVEQFNADRVWLLLDGVDEMGVSGNLLSSIDKHLKGWVDKARIVLTCRLNVWDADKNALYAFDTYRTKQLNYPEMVREFICRFFSKCGEVPKGEKLIEKLEQSPQRIRDLIKNPLRLTLLCRTWKRRQGKLPQTKAELYKGFVETFYDWKDNLEIIPEKRQLLNRALGELAKRAIDTENTKFRLRETFIRQELDKFDKSLFGLACHVSWINKVGLAAENPDEPVYAFFHPTFQEYFAALAIADWHFFLNHVPDNPAQGTYRIFEPQWKEVILLWLGREDVAKEHKEEFIEALVEFEDGCGEFYCYRAYFLVAAGIAEYKNYPKADEILAQIVKWGFGYFDSEKQEWLSCFKEIADTAKIALKETDIQRKTVVLVQLIQQSESEYLCWEAANHLDQNGANYPEVLSALLDSIRKSPKEFCVAKEEILRKIYFRNQKAIADLVELMNNSQDEYTRIISALCIGTIDPGNPQAVGVLVELINDYKDNKNRKLAISILGPIGNKNQIAFDTLLDLFNSCQNEETRKRALMSLGDICTINKKAYDAVENFTNNSHDEYIRWLGKRILLKNNNKQNYLLPINFCLYYMTKITVYLSELTTESQDEEECKFAESILRKINSGKQIEAVDGLVELINSYQDRNIQWEVIESLGEIGSGNQKAIDALVELIKNSHNQNIRYAAVESLGKIDSGNPIVIDTLVELINNRQKIFFFSSVLTSVGEFGLGNPKAVDALVELIRNSKNESIYSEAPESLQKILTEDQMPTVVIALKDSLSQQTYENNFERYKHSLKVIWHCAQNMPYPDFYQAWHQQE